MRLQASSISNPLAQNQNQKTAPLARLGLACVAAPIFAASVFSSSVAQADTLLGIYAEVDYWSANMDGDFGNGDSNGFFKSFEGEPGERSQHGILSAHFEHGIPLLPNIWVRLNTIKYDNTQALNNNVNIGSASFNTASPVNYSFDFSHTDAALYYEILDNWVTLDIGLGAKNMEFEYELRQGSEVYTYEEAGTVPMLYGKAALELPLTGWQITAQAMSLSFEDDRIDDINVELGYNVNSFFQIALGYRQIMIDVETNALEDSEITLDGSYLSFIAHL